MATCGDFGGAKPDGTPCKRRVRDGLCVVHRGVDLHTTAHHKKAFLAALRETGNITRAAEAAGCSRRIHYDWIAADPAYKAEYEDALAEAADHLEAEARRRATEGLVRYKFYEGKPITHPATGQPYYELEYSDTLLIFLLKGAKPEKYRERHEHTGKDGGPIETRSDLSALPLEELLARRAKLLEGEAP